MSRVGPPTLRGGARRHLPYRVEPGGDVLRWEAGRSPPIFVAVATVPGPSVPAEQEVTGPSIPAERGAQVRGPIRVMLVDDHQMILDGLRSMLAPHAERLVLVLATTDTDEAQRFVQEDPPDVALVDVRMKAMFGLDLCARLIAAAPTVRVVMLTVHDDEQYLFQALRAGASGYLTKQVTAEELIAHLERVRDGEVVIEPSLAGQVALSAARLHRGEFWPGAHLGLTQRESEVLELLVKGHSNRAIATRLVLGEETIKTHVRGVYRKLGVGERSQAVAFALREGLFL